MKSVILALILAVITFSCSIDNGDENQEPENQVDLSVVSVKYVGSWS